MSTVIANAAAANVNYLATKAREQACEVLVQAYQGSDDPVVMRRYADCVRLLYPDPSSASQVHALLGILVLSIISFLGAIWYMRRIDWGWSDTLFFSFCAFMFTAAGGCIVMGVIASIR